MTNFLWRILREAIIEGSPEAIGLAAEFVSTRLPITANRVEAFLDAALSVVLALGDGWLDNLAASILPLMGSAPGEAGCDAPDCPHEVAEYADVVEALKAA